MAAVALVLFVLQRYRSPQLAGAAVALVTFPGLVVSPIAGALLDRVGVTKLVAFDYGVGAATSLAVAVLAAVDWLPAPLLLAIIFVSSLSAPLSRGGARSLVPLIAPRHLWERANALDSSSFVLVSIVGAPLAGVLVAVIGGGWTIGVTGVLYAAAGAMIAGLPEPARSRSAHRNVLRSAWDGLRYVLLNPTLRGLALALSVTNIGGGLVLIAVPVLVLTRLNEGPAAVGLLWGINGGAALLSSLVVGRMRQQGRERELIVVATLVTVVAYVLLPVAGSVAIVVLAMAFLGLGSGPLNVVSLGLRQRRMDPAWFGRAITVSMSLNSLGAPIGSALAGPLIARSLDVALWAAVAAGAASILVTLMAIPAEE